jgi:hypothetical protein
MRLVHIKLKQHLPSRLTIAGHTVDATYPGQPQTCFACNETGHIFQTCPHSRRGNPKVGGANSLTWADITVQTSHDTRVVQEIPNTEHERDSQETRDDSTALSETSPLTDKRRCNSDSEQRHNMDAIRAEGGLVIEAPCILKFLTLSM